MTNDYFSDNEAYITNQPLPTPSGTPYHSLSRRTSRYGPSHDDNGPLTAPLPPDPEDLKEEEPPAAENLSLLDPRRFTPTLHASLVSEILSLRRELDAKHKFIDELETSFHGVRNENDALAEQLSASTKEARGAKRQLQQLENGTLSALEEIASERDRIKEANEDLKEKLEGVQKKIRNQEDDSTRVHDMWASEKETWASEKRALERRVHISEARLKMVLDELALQEAAREEAEMESESESIKLESDAGSIRSSPQRRPSTRTARHSRNQSSSSYRSFGRNYRLSHMSIMDGRYNGINLADELAFDEEDEELGELELDSDDFPENEMKARRALESRQSMYQDEKAKRILGLSSSESQQANRDSLPEATDYEEPKPALEFSRSLAHPEVTFVFPPSTPKPDPEDDVKPKYVDTGVQPSPPPSPVRPQTPTIVKPVEAVSPVSEVEANQRKKRVSAQSSPLIPSAQVTAVPRLMISTSSQTVEDPLSPPATPINETGTLPPPPPPPQVTSVSTQTDSFAEPATKSSPPPLPLRSPTRRAPPAPLPVPSIAIHAPTSAPQSPREPILPPGTKTIATQTNSIMTYNMCSTGMQTEPIRIDKRAVKLPPHLLPSAIRSTPGTPESGQERDRTTSVNRKDAYQPVSHASEMRHAAPSARQDLKELLERMQDSKVEDRYPGNNDNGPLVRETENGISRPFRSSSLFAGFHGASSDEEVSNAEMSDEEEATPQWSTPMLSSRNVKNGRVFNNPPTPVPEEKETSPARPSEDSLRTASKRTSMERSAKVSKPARSSIARQPSIRRSAMVQSGTATHMRSRSPSIGSLTSNNLAVTKPPFPVPTRSSSRRPVQSKSEGSQSPTLRSQNSFAGRRPYGQRPQRQDSLRKVRSAAVMQKQPRRPRSRSPPLPASPVIPPSPSLPPIPSELLPGYNFGHRHQLSTTTTYTGSGSVGSAGYQASVVDAIAVAMVGEWMFKYVRKRKAFGGQESPADFSRAGEDSVLNNNGVRHKRWVWISPYERSVLWSHKQPTTGTALLGKSGRKLVIQSVLDVADNTPMPKSAGTQVLFNRSILILTPARALKFTTVSRERHYMWLTALSFLAHSNAPIPELAPPQEEDLPQYQHTGATLRRSHVRDSVRLAKGKANPVAQRYKNQVDMMPEIPSEFRPERPLPAYADPPTIPRGPSHGHGRKRSSTGPGAPPPNIAAYRSFSHNQVPSLYSTGSSDMYSSAQPPSVPSSVYNPQSAITSTRPSESSTSTRQHFFDTMGTVRMEAFINDSVGQPMSASASRPGFAAARKTKRSASNWSASTNDHPRGILLDDLTSESADPFRGF